MKTMAELKVITPGLRAEMDRHDMLLALLQELMLVDDVDLAAAFAQHRIDRSRDDLIEQAAAGVVGADC